jgi:hypothetical protein
MVVGSRPVRRIEKRANEVMFGKRLCGTPLSVAMSLQKLTAVCLLATWIIVRK